MKTPENHSNATHNQGVPGSSPSGTTRKLSSYSNVIAFFVFSCTRFAHTLAFISWLRFQSYDPNPYVNPKAIVYDKFLNESSVNKIKRNNTSSLNRVYLSSDKKEAEASDISIEEMLLKPSIDLVWG